jgi:hypothetical protein
MTGPIVYEPIPHPTLAQLADGADAFGDVSAMVGINFDKLNTRLRGRPARWTLFQGAQSGVSTFDGYSDWAAIIEWPAKTIKLPGKVAGALLIVSAQASANTVGSYPSMTLTVEATGPGVVSGPPRWSVAIASLWGLVQGSRAWWFQAADLVPGQDVTFTPYAGHNDVVDGSVAYGQWHFVVFSGEPS